MIAYIIIALLIALIFYIIWATAIFSKVEIQKTVFPETRIAYVTYVGDYSQAYKQTSVVEQAIKSAYNVDLTREPCFGLYYDNPQKVDKEKCRCIVGKIIPTEFSEKEAPEGVVFDVIPRIDSILHVEYPLRSILSIFAGMSRVYKAISNYTQQNKSEIKTAMLEVYGYKSNKILFAGSTSEASGLWNEFPKEKQE